MNSLTDKELQDIEDLHNNNIPNSDPSQMSDEQLFQLARDLEDTRIGLDEHNSKPDSLARQFGGLLNETVQKELAKRNK